MKIFAVNGSPRKDGNTAAYLGAVLGAMKERGFETELFQFAGRTVRGCCDCGSCIREKNGRCAFDDAVNECIAKMAEADGILLGSPVYFADITPELKALIDRAGRVGRASGNLFRRKAGAGVAVARRAGTIHAFDSINHFFFITEMIVPGSSYWNVGAAREVGDAAKDDEGMRVMRTLGENMAWLLERIRGGGGQ